MILNQTIMLAVKEVTNNNFYMLYYFNNLYSYVIVIITLIKVNKVLYDCLAIKIH